MAALAPRKQRAGREAVGSVCFAIAGPRPTKSVSKLFSGDRERIRRAAAYHAARHGPPVFHVVQGEEMANPANAERSEHKESKADAGKAPAVRDAGRDRAIDLAVSTIEKQFGKGSIMRLGDDIARPRCSSFPRVLLVSTSRSAWAGLPRGRIVEIYGPESSGKTTLALHVVAQAQRSSGICAFVDAEHALDVATRASWA